jgi:hypothetical protein
VAAIVEYWFTLTLTTISENPGNLDPVSKFVLVGKAPASVAMHVFSVGNIISSMHGIPEIATSCKGTYACVRPDRYTYGNYRNTVANVDASDSRCIGKIIARDLRLVASRLYGMAVTRPGSRPAVTLVVRQETDVMSDGLSFAT